MASNVSKKNITRRDWLKAVGLSTAAIAGAVSKSKTASADLSLGSLPQTLARRSTSSSIYKETAIADHARNMQPFGGTMATHPRCLLHPSPTGRPWQFDVLIVGSGYGASIAAARLSAKMQPGSRIALLERGREWVPGTFPDILKDVTDNSRLKLFGRNKRDMNNPTGLFHVLQCDEISVLSGSGLGGSSLINASVALRPDADVFLQTQWPTALRDAELLGPYYDSAELELGVRRETVDWTCKMKAQRLAAEQLRDYGCHFEAAALTLTRSFQGHALPIINRQGLIQRDCIDCGDCLTGCNVGAKNTLAMNYLPIARRNGTMMFTQTEVRDIEKCGGFWKINFIYYDRDERGRHTEHEGCTTARILILGAGSIGSSEILMRSQSEQLDFSRQLGCNWTGNGDALGFVRKTDHPTNIAGFSAQDPQGRRVGPTIQSNVTYPERPNLFDRVLIQEGVAARSYANALSYLMQDFDLDQTQVMLGMGHDRQEGKLLLEDNGNAFISWPGLLESDYRRLIREEFSRLAHGHGGKYKYLRVFGDKMISVHPLGGCGMSDDPRSGVANHKGQVYDVVGGGDIDSNTGEFRIHEGLYVCDGAIFPTAIACNPLLTISALAERAAQLISLEPKYADLFSL
ncbi:MAG: GMC oxidoreductase [Pirellula sp.]